MHYLIYTLTLWPKIKDVYEAQFVTAYSLFRENTISWCVYQKPYAKKNFYRLFVSLSLSLSLQSMLRCSSVEKGIEESNPLKVQFYVYQLHSIKYLLNQAMYVKG